MKSWQARTEQILIEQYHLQTQRKECSCAIWVIFMIGAADELLSVGNVAHIGHICGAQSEGDVAAEWLTTQPP
jgi:hypothetical protein